MIKICQESICNTKVIFIILLSFLQHIQADNFRTNNYNNHGVVGLINMPTARAFNESVHGVTIYNGNPDQKITLTSNPYSWLEASFFYTNVKGYPYPGFEFQDYKDKGFNLKIRLKEEGKTPALAVGFYDFGGTGLYRSEYIVGSYGIKNIDMSFGLGWGRLNSENDKFRNPLGYVNDRFKTRPFGTSGKGGVLELSKLFTGPVSPFLGISYKPYDNLVLKIERDTTRNDIGKPLVYKNRKSDVSFGIDYIVNNSFTLGASFERGNFFSLKFVYKNNPFNSIKTNKYRAAETSAEDTKYDKLVKNLENNGIGVNKIYETSKSIGLDLTQFVHSDLRLIEKIITQSSNDAGINKNIRKNIKIANLDAINELDSKLINNADLIYNRKKVRKINTDTNIRFRPFIASREEFFKGAVLLENDTEFIIRDNLFLNFNLKYNLANNFDDLRYPPIDTFPAQVRSDIKQYLKNMDNGILLGRAQIDYHHSLSTNHHLMFTAGVLEDMFLGAGFEYLYFVQDKNYSFGLEAFEVHKRDYNWKFGTLDYKNTVYSANFFYRNYGLIPFDMKISAGEFLAGDIGSTIEFSRTFRTGVSFGVFASFTDVSYDDFGEGSFDKGIFFNIPIYGNLINYAWRPLTKDPGAKLIRRNNLNDLMVRFKPIN